MQTGQLHGNGVKMRDFAALPLMVIEKLLMQSDIFKKLV